jgi:CDP-glucose 4,6-dehydratase
VTGHTGFPGAWLLQWLRRLDAEVCGYGLAPPTTPSLYALAHAGEGVQTVEADLRDLPALQQAVDAFAPDVVLHLAAQSGALEAYREPVHTFSSNVMGTLHVLEAARRHGRALALVNVSTDSVYRVDGRRHGYREGDELGGQDPHATSKACAELVAGCYALSWLDADGRVALANARSGPVIGGGDWAPQRPLPAMLAAALAGRPARLRQPQARQPWLHVLDVLAGYLQVAEALMQRRGEAGGDWNLGAAADDAITLAQTAERLAGHFGVPTAWVPSPGASLHDDQPLALDSRKAARRLGWRCKLSPTEAVDWAAQWHRACARGISAADACRRQIDAYMARGAGA